MFTVLPRRLTVAVQGPEQRGVGVVRPPAQAVVKVARGVRRRRGGRCRGGEQRGRKRVRKSGSHRADRHENIKVAFTADLHNATQRFHIYLAAA